MGRMVRNSPECTQTAAQHTHYSCRRDEVGLPHLLIKLVVLARAWWFSALLTEDVVLHIHAQNGKPPHGYVHEPPKAATGKA